MMPKSIATIRPALSTKRLPWCMSAWKKPSRMAWRRKDCNTLRAKSLRSYPSRATRARSDKGTPSIHSSVSTSLAVRSQSTSGAWKSWSLATLSRNSEAAAASSRKSVSSFTVRASVSTTSMARSRRPSEEKRSAIRAITYISARSRAKSVFDAGPQHLHRDLALALVVTGVGDMHLRHRGRRHRLAEGQKHLVDLLAQRLLDDLDRRLAPERLHAVLQGGQRIGDFAADDIGPRRQELPELHIGRADLREGAHQRFRAAAEIPARDEIGEPHRQPRRRRQQLGIEPGEHAFAREDIAGARQSQKMPEA